MEWKVSIFMIAKFTLRLFFVQEVDDLMHT